MSASSIIDRIKSLNASYEKDNKSKTKGAPKDTGSILYKFASKVVNNRVLDLYLKTLGITVLTPTTLVPVALLMGATSFSDTVYDIIGLEKRAGGSKKARKTKKHQVDDMYIPIIDDAVFGTYTKYTGAAVQLALSPFTLIPIGLAMTVYEFYGYMNSKPELKGSGSSWVSSQRSGGPINSANLWANYMSSRVSAFGREMTPAETQAITGYSFQQQPNTLLNIAPLADALDGLGAGENAMYGGKRKAKRKSKRKSKRRSNKVPKKVKSAYKKRRNSKKRS